MFEFTVNSVAFLKIQCGTSFAPLSQQLQFLGANIGFGGFNSLTRGKVRLHLYTSVSFLFSLLLSVGLRVENKLFQTKLTRRGFALGQCVLCFSLE